MTSWSSRMAIAISSGRAIANNDVVPIGWGRRLLALMALLARTCRAWTRPDRPGYRTIGSNGTGDGGENIPADPSAAIVPYRDRLSRSAPRLGRRPRRKPGASLPMRLAPIATNWLARQVSAWRQRIRARPEPAEVGPARGRDVERHALVEPWAVPPQVVPDIDHKPSGAPHWNVDDWRAGTEERAGIVEFDGGRRRPDAEARAMACCVAKWLNRHPVRSSPGRCHACGDEPEREALVPFGTTNTGHVWLHGQAPACMA